MQISKTEQMYVTSERLTWLKSKHGDKSTFRGSYQLADKLPIEKSQYSFTKQEIICYKILPI